MNRQERGSKSVIQHVSARKLSDATPFTGLAFDTAGLAIKSLKPGGTPVTLTAQDITTLGTYAAPTANTNIRIKETGIPGLYELHLHNDFFTVLFGVRYAILAIYGVTDLDVPPLRINFEDPTTQGLTHEQDNAALTLKDGATTVATRTVDVDTGAQLTTLGPLVYP